MVNIEGASSNDFPCQNQFLYPLILPLPIYCQARVWKYMPPTEALIVCISLLITPTKGIENGAMQHVLHTIHFSQATVSLETVSKETAYTGDHCAQNRSHKILDLVTPHSRTPYPRKPYPCRPYPRKPLIPGDHCFQNRSPRFQMLTHHILERRIEGHSILGNRILGNRLYLEAIVLRTRPTRFQILTPHSKTQYPRQPYPWKPYSRKPLISGDQCFRNLSPCFQILTQHILERRI